MQFFFVRSVRPPFFRMRLPPHREMSRGAVDKRSQQLSAGTNPRIVVRAVVLISPSRRPRGCARMRCGSDDTRHHRRPGTVNPAGRSDSAHRRRPRFCIHRTRRRPHAVEIPCDQLIPDRLAIPPPLHKLEASPPFALVRSTVAVRRARSRRHVSYRRRRNPRERDLRRHGADARRVRSLGTARESATPAR